MANPLYGEVQCWFLCTIALCSVKVTYLKVFLLNYVFRSSCLYQSAGRNPPQITLLLRPIIQLTTESYPHWKYVIGRGDRIRTCVNVHIPNVAGDQLPHTPIMPVSVSFR